MNATQRHGAWAVTLAAAAILMVTMGARQSLGLFVSPLNTSTGLGVVTDQPRPRRRRSSRGARSSPSRARSPTASARAQGAGRRARGAAIGTARHALHDDSGSGSSSRWACCPRSAPARAASPSSSARRRTGFPRKGAATSAGVINAGGSFGQFVFAPLCQKLIQSLGWMGAMWSLAVITLAALPLVRVVTPRDPPKPKHADEAGMWPTVRGAMSDRSYLLLHLGFFTCGFHIAFLVTHLAAGSEPVRPAAQRRELVARDHRPRQHRRESRARALPPSATAASTSSRSCTARARS